MYKEILDNIAYRILFNDYGIFNSYFWNGCVFLSGTFFVLWGVKLGAKFLRDSFNC